MNIRLLRLALAAFVLTAASCMYDPGVYSEGGYSSDYLGGGYSPGYSSYPRSYGSYSTGYYSSWGSGHGYCSICRHNPCTCSSHRYSSRSRDDCDDHRSGTLHSFKTLDSKTLRVVGGDLDGKARPRGEHSLEWYKDRGYNTSKMKFEDEHGHRYGGSSARSRSDDDDDRHSSSRRHKH